ncbi:MAG: hypothetical protein AB2L22_05220 [Syntrophales bacterium]
MKKTEWNEGSVARRKTAGKGKEGRESTGAAKAAAETAIWKGQANFNDEMLQSAIQGIIHNQVP